MRSSVVRAPLLALLALFACGGYAAATEPPWSVEGSWVDTCSCAVPCPCWKKELPTFGHCSEMFFFHIDKGYSGKDKLDGINLIQVASSADGKTTSESRKAKDYAIANLYVPKGLSPPVVEAIERIFSRLAFAGSLARKHSTKQVEIRSKLSSDHLVVEIPGILFADVKEHKDAAGHPKPFVNPTSNFPWVGPAAQGESEVFTFRDDGASWTFKHRHGTFAPFSYSSARGPLPWEKAAPTPTPR